MFGFGKKAPVEPPKTLVVEPTGGIAVKPILQPYVSSILRRGMWVVYRDKVGVLTNVEGGNVAVVSLCDELGVNTVEIHVNAFEVRQAWHDEIPTPRRPDADTAQRFGYTVRPS